MSLAYSHEKGKGAPPSPHEKNKKPPPKKKKNPQKKKKSVQWPGSLREGGSFLGEKGKGGFLSTDDQKRKMFMIAKRHKKKKNYPLPILLTGERKKKKRKGQYRSTSKRGKSGKPCSSK